MSSEWDQSDAQNMKPFNLLTFSMGWSFWSLCTALSFTALLIRANVATASGAWATLSDLYKETTTTLMSTFPQLFGFPRPQFTEWDVVSTGFLAVITAPFVVANWPYVLEHFRNYRIDLRLLFFILISFIMPIATFVFLYVDLGYFDKSNSRTDYGVLAMTGPIILNYTVTICCSYALGQWGAVFYYLKNGLGAGFILTALATTGFFHVN